MPRAESPLRRTRPLTARRACYSVPCEVRTQMKRGVLDAKEMEKQRLEVVPKSGKRGRYGGWSSVPRRWWFAGGWSLNAEPDRRPLLMRGDSPSSVVNAMRRRPRTSRQPLPWRSDQPATGFHSGEVGKSERNRRTNCDGAAVNRETWREGERMPARRNRDREAQDEMRQRVMNRGRRGEEARDDRLTRRRGDGPKGRGAERGDGPKGRGAERGEGPRSRKGRGAEEPKRARGRRAEKGEGPKGRKGRRAEGRQGRRATGRRDGGSKGRRATGRRAEGAEGRRATGWRADGANERTWRMA
jgi:hypothetical protein